VTLTEYDWWAQILAALHRKYTPPKLRISAYNYVEDRLATQNPKFNRSRFRQIYEWYMTLFDDDYDLLMHNVRFEPVVKDVKVSREIK
jgi:hypothetical protein